MNRTEKLKMEQKIIALLESKPRNASEIYRILGVGSVQLNSMLKSLAKIGVIEQKQNRYEVVQ